MCISHTSYLMVPLTEGGGAHGWRDQPRARQRHPGSDVHCLPVTLVGADGTRLAKLLIAVGLVRHNVGPKAASTAVWHLTRSIAGSDGMIGECSGDAATVARPTAAAATMLAGLKLRPGTACVNMGK